jgi:lipoprotein-anchoring transpeptidase ErfK/SrfK
VPTYPPPDTSDPCYGGAEARWISVDLSQQRLYACEYGTTAASFIVSTGTSLYPTVTGDYRIYVKLLSTTMSGTGYYLPNVPYTMYFYQGYGIHGTYWHNNFGVPMSHGCVNMRTSDAGWLFDWAVVGTLVHVHY